MYKIYLRSEDGTITIKEFKNYEEAEDFYYANQLEFKYIEMKWVDTMHIIDHCYMVGSKLKPIWIGE